MTLIRPLAHFHIPSLAVYVPPRLLLGCTVYLKNRDSATTLVDLRTCELICSCKNMQDPCARADSLGKIMASYCQHHLAVAHDCPYSSCSSQPDHRQLARRRSLVNSNLACSFSPSQTGTGRTLEGHSGSEIVASLANFMHQPCCERQRGVKKSQ